MAGNENGEEETDAAEDLPALLPIEEEEKEEEEGKPRGPLPETTSTRQTWTVPCKGGGREVGKGGGSKEREEMELNVLMYYE